MILSSHCIDFWMHDSAHKQGQGHKLQTVNIVITQALATCDTEEIEDLPAPDIPQRKILRNCFPLLQIVYGYKQLEHYLIAPTHPTYSAEWIEQTLDT